MTKQDIVETRVKDNLLPTLAKKELYFHFFSENRKKCNFFDNFKGGIWM